MKRFYTFVIFTLSVLFIFALAINAADASTCEHTYESYVITEKPIPQCQDNTRPGTAIYTCSKCGATKTEHFDYKHHYHSVVTTPATCTTVGSITHTCEHCNYSETDELPVAHTFHEKVTKEPTCTTAGTVEKTCSKCGKVETSSIPKHKKTALEVLLVPSCFIEGSVKYTCGDCGEIFIDTIPKAHDYETTVTTKPTCTTDGILRHTCLHCNTTHTDVILASHDYGTTNDYIVRIVYADFTKTGVKYYGCTKCGDVGENAEGIIANPLVIFLGYSIPDDTVKETKEGNVEIACTYSIDLEALEEYLSVNGEDSLEYGLVGAYESHLLKDGVQHPPLNNETGVTNDAITGEVAANAVVQKIKFNMVSKVESGVAEGGTTEVELANAFGRLANIDYDNHTTYFYFCLYIHDPIAKRTVYVSDDSCRALPLPISYAMLNTNSEDHETHTNTVTLNGMEYSTVKGTTPTQSRLDIITNSAENYKTNAADRTSASTESTVAGIGNIGEWAGTVPNANALLNYYLELGGDATHYTELNIQELLDNVTTAKNSWISSINNILRAGELMAIKGETINIDQVWETTVQLSKPGWLWNDERDWYLTFIDGFYYTDTDIDNLTVTEVNGVTTYSATIVYTVIDYYSFQKYLNSNDTKSFLLWGPTTSELAALHNCGAALDFLIESSITYEVKWTKGQRVGKDNLFNSNEMKELLDIKNETNVGIDKILVK